MIGTDRDHALQNRTTAVLAAVAVAALVVIGSIVYWIAEGRPGTPEELRQRVADAGLEVEWSDNGPRGGDGMVSTDCGDTPVTISELDGSLYLFVDRRRAALTTESIDDLLTCDR